MRIDAHTHIAPSAYIDAIPLPGGNLGKPPVVTVEELEEMMDRYAIDAAVVCTGPPGLYFGDQGQANELARLTNEEMAGVLRRGPGKVAALGVLPLPGGDAALARTPHVFRTPGPDRPVMPRPHRRPH